MKRCLRCRALIPSEAAPLTQGLCLICVAMPSDFHPSEGGEGDRTLARAIAARLQLETDPLAADRGLLAGFAPAFVHRPGAQAVTRSKPRPHKRGTRRA